MCLEVNSNFVYVLLLSKFEMGNYGKIRRSKQPFILKNHSVSKSEVTREQMIFIESKHFLV